MYVRMCACVCVCVCVYVCGEKKRRSLDKCQRNTSHGPLVPYNNTLPICPSGMMYQHSRTALQIRWDNSEHVMCIAYKTAAIYHHASQSNTSRNHCLLIAI